MCNNRLLLYRHLGKCSFWASLTLMKYAFSRSVHVVTCVTEAVLLVMCDNENKVYSDSV